MRRRFFPVVCLQLVCFAFAAAAQAGGGNYAILGGTPSQRAQVHEALEASSFNWSVVPQLVTITITPRPSSDAVPGQIFLDSALLATGSFSWGVVQHEYAHQVDFMLFDEAVRQKLQTALGGTDWCYEVPGLAHDQHACERFASTLAWAYWQSPLNSMKPAEIGLESGALTPAAFRALVASLLGPGSETTGAASPVAVSPAHVVPALLAATSPSPRAYAPALRTKTRRVAPRRQL
ncbi:MAG: hypothetical protein QOE36_2294 [Gaiellaceae bacterium]|nr:hypothetical protein [Gaiellaceae bacterium]